jgi:hypothetical protein
MREILFYFYLFIFIFFLLQKGRLPTRDLFFDTQSIVLALFRWLWGLPDSISGLLRRQSGFAGQILYPKGLSNG